MNSSTPPPSRYVRVQETTDLGLDGFDFEDGGKAYQIVGRVITIDLEWAIGWMEHAAQEHDEYVKIAEFREAVDE